MLMLNNHNKMRCNNRTYLIVVALTVLTIFSFMGLTSAADPGHEGAVIGSETFESGNFVFPSNLNAENANVYKLLSFVITRMFPSDPRGSLDDYFSADLFLGGVLWKKH